MNDKINPAPYSHTDYPEDESIHIFKNAINRKNIKTDIKSRDKYPNFDGYIELVDDSNIPIGKFEVQVKTIQDDSKIYYCELSTIAYSEITTLPMLLVLVKIKQKKAYWKHLIKENSTLTDQGKSYKFTLSENDEVIESNNYIFEWTTILNDYQKRIQNYRKIESMVDLNEYTIPPINIDQKQIEFFQTFIDSLNTGIDTIFPFLKKYKFTDIWKLGVAIQKDNWGISFGLYAIPIGKTDLLIKEINTNKEFDMNLSSFGFLQFYSSVKSDNDPTKLANKFLTDYVENVIDRRSFFFNNIELAKEYVFSLINRYYYMFGLKKANNYNLNEIRKAFSFYFPLWISVALDTIDYPPHIPYIDIGLFTIRPTEEVNRKVREIIDNDKPYAIKETLIFNSREEDLFIFQQSLNILFNNDIHEIESPFPLPDYSIIKDTRGYFRWEAYSLSDLNKIINLFFSNVFYIINNFLKDNKFPDEYLIELNDKNKIIIIPEIKDNLHQPDAIIISILLTCSPFFVPFVEGKPQAILEINSYGDNPFNPL